MENLPRAKPPLIPKRLASRLRAVYAKLAEARLGIAYGEAEIAYLREYLAYYDADPEQFAERHYPRHSFDSYPVVTHISRHREDLLHREDRVPQYYAKLLAAEEAVALAEAHVLEQVAKIRPNTVGREPWPRAPLLLGSKRKTVMKDRMSELQKYLKYVEVHSQKRKQEESQRRAKLIASMEEIEMLWNATLAAMPPAKASVYGAFWNAMRESLSSGALLPQSLGAIGGGLDSTIRDALERTRRTLEAGDPPHHTECH